MLRDLSEIVQKVSKALAFTRIEAIGEISSFNLSLKGSLLLLPKNCYKIIPIKNVVNTFKKLIFTLKNAYTLNAQIGAHTQEGTEEEKAGIFHL